MLRLSLLLWWLIVAAATAAAAQEAPFKAAHLQALDKVTTRVSELEAKPLLPVSFGTLDIAVHRCWRSQNDKRPDQAVLIEIRERKAQMSESELLFSGWMFQSSPALSALEHPVYDLKLLRCE